MAEVSKEIADRIRKRILIPIVGKGSIVHLIRSGIVEQMKSFCEPVIGFTWHQEDLMQELASKGFEVHLLPPYSIDESYKQLRRKIDLWYFEFILKTPSTQIQKRLKNGYRKKRNVIKSIIKERYEGLKSLVIPLQGEKNIRSESKLIRTQPAFHMYEDWLTEMQIDGLFTVTPFIHEIELLARLLRNNNKPVIASIHSFDNVTKRGWPAIIFDSYFVWNKYNRDELLRINSTVQKENIFITGAPQFDFHYKKSFGIEKEEWLRKMGIPAGKKIILYAGSVPSLFPDEPQYVLHLKEAIEKNLIDEDVVILVRNHPLDNIQRWENTLEKSPVIFFDINTGGKDKMDHSNVSIEELRQFISTLNYSDVHINLCSTMAVDGSVFNKPQIGPAYNSVNKNNATSIRNMYFQEHYVPIMKTGVVKLAHSAEQLIHLVNEGLKESSVVAEVSQNCVKEIITYTDGKSSDRVVSVLKTFFAR